MNVGVLRVDQPAIQGQRAPLDREVHRWLRLLRAALGFESASPVYDEIAVGGASMSLSGTAMAAFNGTILLPEFVNGSTCSAMLSMRLPNAYRPGTAVKPFVDWVPSTSGAGDVSWELEYAAAASGEVFPAASTISKVVAAPAALTVVRTEFDDIDGSSLVQGSSVVCRLGRIGAAVADTYAGSVWFIAAGIKYERVGVGSEEAHP